MAQLFGKNYQETGKSSSPLLLRSNGEIKLQWGNKFIDLVKNGKINSEAKDCIFTVDTSDEIKANGIYLVTEDSSIWINVEGAKTKLSDDGTTYVSFLTEQKTTPEQKQQALTNLGLIYENIDTLNKANLITGLAYVVESNKLYLIQNGVVSEYQVTLALPTSGKFDDLAISNLTIKNNTINSSQLILTINNIPYLQLNDNILCSVPFLVDKLQSVNYNYNKSGFALYQDNGKSVLDIDSLNWRNIESELPKNQKTYITYTILGDFNIVTEVTDVSSETESLYKLQLKYPNNIPPNLPNYILAELETTYNIFLLTTKVQVQDNISYNQIVLDKNIPETYQLYVKFSDSSTKLYSRNDAKLFDVNLKVDEAYLYNNGIDTKYIVDIDSAQKHDIIPLEFEVCEIDKYYIIIKLQNTLLASDLLNATQLKIYQARVPQFIQGEGFLALRKWDSVNNKYVYHTIIGTYKESEFGISDDTNDKFGFYSDDVKVAGISLSGAKFSGQLPSFIDTKPETIADNQFPTMEIVNEKIKKAVDNIGDTNIALVNKNPLPKGSIIMFNSTQNIPDGWCICDGTNGTPNLIGKFIKAGNSLTTNETDLDENNYLTINQENLPNHSHGSLSSEQKFLTSAYLTESNSGINDTFYSATEGKEVKVQTSSSTLNISDSKTTFNNTPIKVEPNAYSLIFIMKYKDLD